jgi:S-DNA-T family DNA segregation ATPase FtsK/SpoIIIE
MRVVLRSPAGEMDLEVAVHDPASTVAHLAAALAADGAIPPALSIDGRPVPGSTALVAAGLHPGCEIALSTAASAPGARRGGDDDGGVTELLVVGGLAAGGRHPLARGGSMIGRDPTCDVVLPLRTTSSRHATVFVEAPDAVSLADAGSAAGTWIDGRRVTRGEVLAPGAVAALGACLVRIEAAPWCEPAVLGRPDRAGRRSLQRPPPPPAPEMPAPVVPPGGEPAPADAPRFGWAAALVPLVGGLVLARLVDPRMALFTLLGPAVLLGQWLEDKRRHRRRRADAGAARRNGLGDLASGLSWAAATETRRRCTLHPDPAALVLEIESLGSRLWSRRPGHPSFGAVSVGTGPALAWTPPTTRPADGPALTVLAASRLLPACPVPVELAPGSHVGIAGARVAALAVARWMVVQLAAHHGPADLRIAVVCQPDRAGDWAWTAFLPHVAPPAAGGRRLLAAGGAQAGELAQLLRGATDPGPLVIVVVDGDDLVDGHAPVASSFGSAATTLTIGPSRRSLPGRCTSVLELEGPDGWSRLTGGDEPGRVVLATGIEPSTAKRCARGLAQLADPEQGAGGVAPPRTARLLDLLDLDEPTVGDVLHRWAERRGPVVPIGCTGGPRGPGTVVLDLVGDGPHALIAGTTGAGKSELLRSLVAGLAASAPPDRLVMLLVDYKGGAAFAEAAGLPHVLDVVTDLGPDEAARALRSLEAEVRRREAVLAQLGLRDLAEHPAHGPDPPGGVCEPMPRLVVVVDELAALTAELPAFLDDLVQLAARGRSLGLHLVLATQRPGSVVSAAVRTNCTIRCCLRVPEEADAVDVVGSPAPARLDRRLAGRAFLRRGAGDLVEVQVALAGGRRPPARPPVSVHRAAFGPEPLEPDPPGDGDDGPSDLAALVEACRGAAARCGQGRPRPLWLPPLPASLPASQLPPSADGAVIGLLDDPGCQRRLPVTWRPRTGPLLAVGAGTGPAVALRAAARALASGLGPGGLHVYGAELGAQGLAPLAELPHVGALVRAGEHERLHRLVDRLAAELATRKAAVAEARSGGHDGGAPAPLILLLIDGVAGLRSAFDGASGLAALDLLERVVVDGPPLGLAVALAADRLAAVPGAWAAAASVRLAFRGGDPLDLLAIGARGVDRSAWPDGRCLDLGSGLVGQVATGGWPAAMTGPAGAPGPAPVGTLPRRVRLAEVLAGHPSRAEGGGLCLTLGLDGRDLRPATARLRLGQAFLVCGAPGSGRSTALGTLAASAEAAGCVVVDPDRLTAALDGRAGGLSGPPIVVVVDDADRVADGDGTLSQLAAGRIPGVHLVAGAPPEAVRAAFGHWSADLRRAGAGVVLQPRSDLDADVLGIPLLPRWPLALGAPGRGVLVTDGSPVPVQVAVP